jgi:hypothetical protein
MPALNEIADQNSLIYISHTDMNSKFINQLSIREIYSIFLDPGAKMAPGDLYKRDSVQWVCL